MSIKLVVTDLDGTLLRTDKTISAFTIDTLTRCREKGVLLALATARPIRSVNTYLQALQVDAVVYHNGSVVHLYGNEGFSARIPATTVRDVLSGVWHRNQSATLSVEINDQLYYDFDDPILAQDPCSRRVAFRDLPDYDADKIIIGNVPMEELIRIKEFLPPDLYIEICEYTFGLIMSKKASKINGVKWIAEQLGIDLSETAAFGDDYNDVQMLQSCDFGVAMANGIDEVKRAACYQTLCNDEDGVARFLHDSIGFHIN